MVSRCRGRSAEIIEGPTHHCPLAHDVLIIRRPPRSVVAEFCPSLSFPGWRTSAYEALLPSSSTRILMVLLILFWKKYKTFDFVFEHKLFLASTW